MPDSCTGCANAASCGGCSSCGGCAPALSDEELNLLLALSERLYLPIARFLLVPKGCWPEDGTVILSPVLLRSETDSLDEVDRRARLLVLLARKRMLTLDYDIPISNHTYEEFYRSDLFREFNRSFGASPDGRPTLQKGSAAITEAGLNYCEGHDRNPFPGPGSL